MVFRGGMRKPRRNDMDQKRGKSFSQGKQLQGEQDNDREQFLDEVVHRTPRVVMFGFGQHWNNGRCDSSIDRAKQQVGNYRGDEPSVRIKGGAKHDRHGNLTYESGYAANQGRAKNKAGIEPDTARPSLASGAAYAAWVQRGSSS